MCLIAVSKHNFDNHEHCGGQCKVKGTNGEEKKKNTLRIGCKTKNMAMYRHFKILDEEFMEVDKLKQAFHLWDINACEGFNKLMTKCLPIC
jgi:hypothetical protein